jgi:hypothetical protein
MAIQDKFNRANVIYKITKDIDLGGGTLTIPEGCTLDFQGGSFSNGTIMFNNTLLKGSVKILTSFSGNIINENLNVLWFGVNNDGNSDVSKRINEIIQCIYQNTTSEINGVDINVSKTIYFPCGQYLFDNTVELLHDENINGIYSTVNIIGENKGSTLFYTKTDGIQGLLKLSGSNYNKIENFTVMSNDWGTSSRNSGVGIIIEKWCNQIDVNNIVCRGFDIGINATCQASSIRNVMARDCKTGFKINATSLSLIGCYAAACKTDNEDGVGYSISGFYCSVLNCAADSNDIGYKLLDCVSVTVNGCGAEGNKFGLYVDPTSYCYHNKISVYDCPLADVNNNTPIFINNKDTAIVFSNQTFDLSKEFVVYGEEAQRHLIFFENCKSIATISSKIINKYPFEYGKDIFKALPFDGALHKANKEITATANNTSEFKVEGDLVIPKSNGQFLCFDVIIRQISQLADLSLSEDIPVRISVGGYSTSYATLSVKNPVDIDVACTFDYTNGLLHYIITVPAGYYKGYGWILIKGDIFTNYGIKDVIKSTMYAN